MDAALLAALYCAALALRLVPLTFSTLPFNIDGFPLARIASDIMATGSWQIDEADPNAYNLKLPGYSLLWSGFAQLGGLHPLTDLQWAQALVTSLVVVPGYLLGLRATRHRGVACASAVFLAAFGSFLFLTSAVMKESMGLVLLPAMVLAFHDRADPRRRGIALLLLLVLLVLHHLTALIALGTTGALVVLAQRRSWVRGTFRVRTLAADVASVGLPAAAGWAYYDAVDMPFFRDLTGAAELALFLVIVVLVAFLLSRMDRPARVREGRRTVGPASHVLLVPAIALGALLANAQTSVFAGTLGTRPALYPVIAAFAVLAAFVVLGYQAVRRTTNRANDLVVASFTAPVALILFAFLRGLDPLSHAIVYRAFDFLDYGIAVLAGVGLVLAWRALGRAVPRVAVIAVFLAALVATTPVAWNSQEVFGVENVVTPAEFEALRVLVALGARNVTTDQRLADVAEWWFGIAGDATLPTKLRDGQTIDGFEYALVLERWTAAGAQVHPAPNVVLSADTLGAFLADHPRVFEAGRPGDRAVVVRLAGNP